MDVSNLHPAKPRLSLFAGDIVLMLHGLYQKSKNLSIHSFCFLAHKIRLGMRLARCAKMSLSVGQLPGDSLVFSRIYSPTLIARVVTFLKPRAEG